MTEEQLRDKAAEAYNSLGKNQPPYQWMDGYVAGYVAHEHLLQQCSVSGSLPFHEVKSRILAGNAKSEYKQAAIVILRNVYSEVGAMTD